MNQLCKEPGAEKPHAGICRGAGLVTGRSTRPDNFAILRIFSVISGLLRFMMFLSILSSEAIALLLLLVSANSV